MNSMCHEDYTPVIIEKRPIPSPRIYPAVERTNQRYFKDWRNHKNRPPTLIVNPRTRNEFTAPSGATLNTLYLGKNKNKDRNVTVKNLFCNQECRIKPFLIENGRDVLPTFFSFWCNITHRMNNIPLTNSLSRVSEETASTENVNKTSISSLSERFSYPIIAGADKTGDVKCFSSLGKESIINDEIKINQELQETVSVFASGEKYRSHSKNSNSNFPIFSDDCFEDIPVASLLSKPVSLDFEMDEDSLEIFLNEEEFDDDTIIRQNMIDGENVDVSFQKTTLSDTNQNILPISSTSFSDKNINDKHKETKNSQLSTRRSTSSVTIFPTDDSLLYSIVALNTKLEDLIKSCRSMNSELKGILILKVFRIMVYLLL